jgi:hypothetical protein
MGETDADEAEAEAGDGHTQESACLNCGVRLSGDYCHACGQKAHVHRTLGAFGHDLLHGVLHFEGKIWRTLPMLAWHPGALTRRYVAGERARFVSPIALFLFSVFLMFAVFGTLGGSAEFGTGLRGNIAESIEQTEVRIRQMEQERAQLGRQRRPTAEVEQQIRTAREEAELLRTMQERGLVRGATLRVSDDLPPFIRRGIEKANANPSLAVYKLQSNAYKYSWALIPISLPFLWLLLLHRRRYRSDYGAYDHVVFITYSIAFMSLLIIALVVLQAFGMPGVLFGFGLLLIPPIHMYRQLRGAYLLSRFGAAWRTAALLGFAGTALCLFLILLLASGVLR